MNKLSYCMMKNEGSIDAYVVYIILPDTDMPHPSVVNNEHFPLLKSLLEKHGFEQTTMMSFRIGKRSKLKVRPLHAELLANGFTRNRSLEKILKSHLEKENSILTQKAANTTHYTPPSAQTMTSAPVFYAPNGMSLYSPFLMKNLDAMDMHSTPKKRRNKVLEVGESIKLNVYLFIRAIPTDEGIIEFEFEFDFFSRKNNEMRQFIKIIECEFIRKDQEMSNIIYLESSKTLKDILKELDFLYSILVPSPSDVMEGTRTESIIYSAIELKEFLNLDGRISLHVDVDNSYDEILHLSNVIGTELADHHRNAKILVSLVREASEKVLNRMEHRMLYYSNNENYELAASYKKSHAYIQNKVRALNDFSERGVNKLTIDDYEDCFTMKDLDF